MGKQPLTQGGALQRETAEASVPALDMRGLRDALGRFATGVTIITGCAPDGRALGLTVNSFSALSLAPPLVSWSLRLESRALPGFLAAGHFAVNVLAAEQQLLGARFARRCNDGFAGIAHRRGAGGCPVISGSLASFECRTSRSIEAGDHMLFVGEVLNFESVVGAPLLFFAGRLAPPASIGLA
jgi:flavin reductase (DIM6/NTAB) family NADH-FMN oxidoreductase RutF